MQMRCMGMGGLGGGDMSGFGGANMPGFGGMPGSAGGGPGLGGGSRGGESSLMNYRRGRNDNDSVQYGRRQPRASGSTETETCDEAAASEDGEAFDASAGATAPDEDVDIGLKHLQAMEQAQIAMAVDAKKRKLELATAKAAQKKAKPSAAPSKPAWDIGEDETDEVAAPAEGEDYEPAPTPKSGRKKVQPACPLPVSKVKAVVAASPKGVAAAPAKAKAAAVASPKGKAAAAAPPKAKAGKVAAADVTPTRTKAVVATPTKAKAAAAAAVPPKGNTSLHGISFLDLVQPTAARDAKSRGAYTSRAYDLTKKRAASKFGGGDVRVLETSRAAYKMASDFYTQACG
jgi:hypothetical protein